MAYEIPSAASGDAGLEGFTVEAAGRRIGRVAAVNRTREGLVLLVDAGGAVRAAPLDAVERVELRPRRIVLAEDGEWPPVEARVVRVESPQLVRHLPRELDAVTVEGEPGRRRGIAPFWLAGTLLFAVGGIALFVGISLAIEGVGGGARWLWVAIPAAVSLAGAVLLWRGLSAGPGRDLSLRGRAGLAASFVLGISPPERRRPR
ncbi:MAG TPA: hypothetical protein VE088_05565 [Gaiellaceae bacterium]|nr:hypothetical protein [Gaiellaceae bacterium]